MTTPLQDLYPDDYAHCYGCGRLNADGLHVKSTWHDDACIARFTPRASHIAVPGYVYGGLIASLMDCHGIATAAAAWMAANGTVPGSDVTPRFVTGSLHVDYLKPTPHGVELMLTARATDIGDRKVSVEVAMMVGDTESARGRVVAVRLPPTMAARA